MNSMKFGIINSIALVILALLTATVAVGQPAPPPPAPQGAPFGHGPGMEMLRGEFGEGGKIVKGAPLSGDFIVNRDTTLADGNRIHNESQSKVYRDMEGRVRREMGLDLATPATGSVKRNLVVIMDPVAGKRYILNPENKTAREVPTRRPQGEGHEDHMKPMGGPDSATANKEELGTKTVNGIQAEGVRVTRTIPAGAIGNDKPIAVVTERWYSPDLQITVLTTHTDPMMGSVTTKLVNVTRGDPDASLFQIPADYKIEVGKPNDMMYMPMKP
jgi:hypothetical protein